MKRRRVKSVLRADGKIVKKPTKSTKVHLGGTLSSKYKMPKVSDYKEELEWNSSYLNA